jgi:hypothetical protein
MPENNFQLSAVDNALASTPSSALKRDHTRTVSGAVEMLCLVKKSKYDERVLGSKFKTMQDDITA